MKDIFFPKRMWRRHELKKHYDVVIVGGGAHGLATAYYLAKNHGVKNVAVLEKSYIGAGGSGRNTTIIRSNYRTPEGAAFYRKSVELYETLSQELDFNLMFSQHGHLTLAHSDRGMITAAERAEVNQLLGIESHVVDTAEVKRLCPQINVSTDATWPIVRRALPPAGRDHPPRRGRLGLRERRRPCSAPRSTRTPRSPGIDVEDGRVHGRADEPRRHLLRHGRLLHGRLVDPDRRHGRRAAADLDEHPPGLRHRAGQAVPRRGDRLVARCTSTSPRPTAASS